ncbi:MAG: hypothetical protein QXW38_08510 [Candidatus Nitrosotenuis sp.]
MAKIVKPNYPNNAWDIIKDLDVWDWLIAIGVAIIAVIFLFYLLPEIIWILVF